MPEPATVRFADLVRFSARQVFVELKARPWLTRLATTGPDPVVAA
jgi:hypothetical protein